MSFAQTLRALGLATAALCIAVALPGEHALATCGDYVTTGGYPATHGFVVGPETLTEMAGRVSNEFEPFPHGGNRPCQGPNCSRRSAPLSTPFATAPTHSDDSDVPVVVACDFSIEPLDIIPIGSSPHPHASAGIVFRPPRCI